MQYIDERLTTPVRDHADVIVVGGGIAGVAAAVAARRQGADVLIIEKSALFGGLATNGLISWYEPLCDGEGTQLMYGLPEELLRLSVRYGQDTLPQIWKHRLAPDGPSQGPAQRKDPAGGRYATDFLPCALQLALDELLLQEGVRIRLDMAGVQPVMEGTRCRGIITESVSGREAYTAEVVIDATGDATLLYRAGVPCVEGKNYFSFTAREVRRDPSGTAFPLAWHNIGSNLFGKGHPAGYPLVSGTENAEETDFLLEGRKQLLDKLRGQDRDQHGVFLLPSQAQFRTTRRLSGGYTLKEADDHQYRERSVALFCDFKRSGAWYELPFEALYHPGFPNLLAAGRMISAEGWAWDVARIIPCCAASGEAAGIAAALAVQTGTDPGRIDIRSLQEHLRDRGVRIHRDEV